MKFFRELISRDGLIAVAKLIPFFLFFVAFWALFDQTGSSWVLQAGHGPRVPRQGLARVPDPGAQSDPGPGLHPDLHLLHLPGDQPLLPAHPAAQDRHRPVHRQRRLRGGRLQPVAHRCRPAAVDRLADPRLRPDHRRRGDGLHRRPRVRLHPGAAHHEVADHVDLPALGLRRQPCSSRQINHWIEIPSAAHEQFDSRQSKHLPADWREHAAQHRAARATMA